MTLKRLGAFAAALCAILLIAAPGTGIAEEASVYRVSVSNDTDDYIWVEFKNKSCASIVIDNKVLKIPPKTSSIQWAFFRDTSCRGQNGFLYIDIMHSIEDEKPLSAPLVADSAALLFTDDGKMWMVPLDPLVGDRRFSFTYKQLTAPKLVMKYYDGVLRVGSTRENSLDDVKGGGCKAEADRKAAMTSLLALSGVGTLTRKSASAYAIASEVSSLQVNTLVWGFRGPTLGDIEVTAMQAGYLLSPAMNALKNDSTGPWALMGPIVSGPSDAIAFAMRSLAVSDSRQPKSQFVSVALNPKVAEHFGEVTYIYAFQVVPFSEIFGQKTCGSTEGEIQVQIFGGTQIFNLMRRLKTGDSWEAWKNGQWTLSAVVPSNAGW